MKPNKKLLTVVAASALLLWSVSSCAQDVQYNFMPGTDFAKYRTYKWVRITNVQYPNQILDAQIIQAIDSQLALKGLAKTESETADLYVCYQAAVNQEKQWNSYSNDMGGWAYGRWGGWGGYGGGMSTTTQPPRHSVPAKTRIKLTRISIRQRRNYSKTIPRRGKNKNHPKFPSGNALSVYLVDSASEDVLA